jgi:hypothetical protein
MYNNKINIYNIPRCPSEKGKKEWKVERGGVPKISLFNGSGVFLFKQAKLKKRILPVNYFL